MSRRVSAPAALRTAAPPTTGAPPGVAAPPSPVGRTNVWVRTTALATAAHLGPTLAVTAIVAGLSSVSTDWRRTVGATAAVLCGQLSVGWSNDAIDETRDREAGRLDKPLVVGTIGRATVWRGAALAVLGCVVLSLSLGWRPGGVHLLAVAMAWSYNARLKNSMFSPVPYGVAFGALPAFLTLNAGGGWPPWWAMVVAAQLGIGAHFFNVLPDLAVDRRSGLRGLPQRCRPGVIAVIGAGVSAAAVLLVACFAPWRGGPWGAVGIGLLAVAAACIVATVACASLGALRRAWTLSIATALLVSASLLVNGPAILR